MIDIQAVFVAGQDFAPPEVPAAKDTDNTLQPPVGRPADEDADGAVDNPKVIRGLLGIRQNSCPTNFAACNDGG